MEADKKSTARPQVAVQRFKTSQLKKHDIEDRWSCTDSWGDSKLKW